MEVLRYIALIFFIVLSLEGFSEQARGPHDVRHCSREDAMAAEKNSSTLKTWSEVYREFKRFGHCDDGAIGEGYSSSIGRLLSEDWASFHDLIVLAKSDNEFEQFCIKHIDETIPSTEISMIRKNAEKLCPAGGGYICKKILEAANR
jgi:hypothetical protein